MKTYIKNNFCNILVCKLTEKNDIFKLQFMFADVKFINPYRKPMNDIKQIYFKVKQAESIEIVTNKCYFNVKSCQVLMRPFFNTTLKLISDR